jgi:hypothetical protein
MGFASVRSMDQPRFQYSLGRMLGLVACAAVNLWLFRVNTLLGLFGLMLSKHVLIAMLCHSSGVDKAQAPKNLDGPQKEALPFTELSRVSDPLDPEFISNIDPRVAVSFH